MSTPLNPRGTSAADLKKEIDSLSEQLAAANREIETATAEPRARVERLTRQIEVLGQRLAKQAHAELGGAW